MKSLLLFILPFFISFYASAQLLNTAPIVPNKLYAAKTELSNIEYLEFINELKEQGKTEEYLKLLPDTNNPGRIIRYGEPYRGIYFRHPAYSKYPVVNITYENANAYCEWLTNKLNTKLQTDKKSHFKKVLVRLPSKVEWENAARGGNEDAVFSWGADQAQASIKDIKKVKGKTLAYHVLKNDIQNTKPKNLEYLGAYHSEMEPNREGYVPGYNDVPSPVESFWPNPFGLYNMSGNVAEMVQEKGIIKGGSWETPLEYLKIDAESLYSDTLETSFGIGFRYFIEVLETTPN